MASDEQEFGIGDDVFGRLFDTAPEWPEGRLAFRSFRIRFGEGSNGVALTFKLLVRWLGLVFDPGFSCSPHLFPDELFMGKPVDRLRLLMGNHTHRPTVEWTTFNLDTHRDRDGLTVRNVRGPKSLADELLVFACLFPEYIRDISREKNNPALFAAGYEANFPEYMDCQWREIPVIGFDAIFRGNARLGSELWDANEEEGDFSVPEAL